MNNTTRRLIELNAASERVINFNYHDEDESHLLRNTAAGAGALGVAGTGALYARGENIRNAWGKSSHGPGIMNGLKDAGQSISTGYRQMPGDLGAVGQSVKDVGSALGGTKGLYDAARSNIQIPLRAPSRMAALKEALSGTGKALRKAVHLSNPIALVRLNALASDLLEFRSQDNDESHALRNGLIAIGGGAAAMAGGAVGHTAIMGKYSKRFLRSDRSVKETYKRAAKDIGGKIKDAAGDAGESVRGGYNSVRDRFRK